MPEVLHVLPTLLTVVQGCGGHHGELLLVSMQMRPVAR